MPNIAEQLANLPPELLPYKANILATVKPVIEITLSPADDLPLWASKVGGKPYLPLDVEYPHDKNGNPLLLLAQINCEELPQNDIFPKTGILSFFVDFEEGNVLYFDNVIQDTDKLLQNFDGINVDEDSLPFFDDVTFSPEFTLTQKAIGCMDFQAQEKIFAGHDISQEQADDLEEIIYDHTVFDSTGHHLLGYPFFTQEDPRAYKNGDVPQDYILLFQLDTDEIDGYEIMWGDGGVGNFFIHPNDLKNGYFSKVKFSWDCC